MPKTTPLPSWEGSDAYLIGGGPSLRGFDFSKLRGKNTIGCNQAFFLGGNICQICFFGDENFWRKFQKDLADFDGWVVTRHTAKSAPPWLIIMPHVYNGLDKTKLGWNRNSGACAISLALLLGAKNVYLLGYDLGVSEADPNVSHWHDKRIEVPRKELYPRFLQGFANIARDLPLVFPGRTVTNVTDGSSKLTLFPTVTYEEHFRAANT
jgi:hypothetical protein